MKDEEASKMMHGLVDHILITVGGIPYSDACSILMTVAEELVVRSLAGHTARLQLKMCRMFSDSVFDRLNDISKQQNGFLN